LRQIAKQDLWTAQSILEMVFTPTSIPQTWPHSEGHLGKLGTCQSVNWAYKFFLNVFNLYLKLSQGHLNIQNCLGQRFLQLVLALWPMTQFCKHKKIVFKIKGFFTNYSSIT
jgi:hypothetical protein